MCEVVCGVVLFIGRKTVFEDEEDTGGERGGMRGRKNSWEREREKVVVWVQEEGGKSCKRWEGEK